MRGLVAGLGETVLRTGFLVGTGLTALGLGATVARRLAAGLRGCRGAALLICVGAGVGSIGVLLPRLAGLIGWVPMPALFCASCFGLVIGWVPKPTFLGAASTTPPGTESRWVGLAFKTAKADEARMPEARIEPEPSNLAFAGGVFCSSVTAAAAFASAAAFVLAALASAAALACTFQRANGNVNFTAHCIAGRQLHL